MGRPVLVAVIFCKAILSSTLFLTFVEISSSLANDNCNAIYTHTNGEDVKDSGRCTKFEDCPYLFDIIRNPHKTSNEVKLLQDLTCKPDNDNPLVCCAFEDILSKSNNNNSDYTIEGTSNLINGNAFSGGGGGNGLIFESESKPAGSKPEASNNERFLGAAETMDERFRSFHHPNFNLLPPLSECSVRVESSDRIIGGNKSSILEYPWLARIGYYDADEDSIKYLCAGTVINKRYVLTAAHCTQDVNFEEFIVPVHIRFGERDKSCNEFYGCSTPLELKIEKIITHPNYNKVDKTNDIALIRVAEDISFDTVFIKPVCLPFIEEYGLADIVDPTLARYADSGKDTAFVAGWGKTSWMNVDGSKYLMHVRLPIVSQKQCQKSYRNVTNIQITDKQLCAGGKVGKDSCGGDSGGGLFVQESVSIFAKLRRGKMFQFGIVSFGPTHCAEGRLQGVYSQVYAYKKWILDHLNP